MHSTPLISILIPAFNAEKFIIRCINSILSQKVFKKYFEIIIVNDGSIDNTGIIVESNFPHDSNIMVYNRQNEGVACARNFAISKARGNYLMFVDADDELMMSSLENLLFLINTEYDIVICKSFKYTKTKSNPMECYPYSLVMYNHSYSGLELFKKKYVRGSVCGCLFNRKYLKKYDLYFPSGITNAEDTFFMLRCFLHANYILMKNVALYKINVTLGSASQSRTIDTVYNLLLLLSKSSKLLKNFKSDSIQSAMICNFSYIIICSSFNILSSIEISKYEFKNIKKIIKSSGTYPFKGLKISPDKYQMILFNLSIDFSYWLIKLRSSIWPKEV